MKSLAITIPNLEDIAVLEVKEIIGTKKILSKNKKSQNFLGDQKSEIFDKKAEIVPGAVIFEASDKEIAEFCYKSQSPKRILKVIDYFKFSDTPFKKLKEISEKITKKELYNAKSFKVEAEDIEIKQKIGGFIHDKLKIKVDLENPAIVVYVYVCDNFCCIGIDFSGEIDKRDYKIFNCQRSIKGNLAYCLTRLSGFDCKKVLLDCFSGSGEIPIEAALFCMKKSLHFFSKDKFNFLKLGVKYDFKEGAKEKSLGIHSIDNSFGLVKLAKQNAKIAGINKAISFSKLDVEWLDTKFGRNSVDCIVSRAPEASKNIAEKEIKKVYKELFYNTDFILAKKGTMVFLLREPELLKKSAEEYKFKVKEEREVFMGKERFRAVVFER